jgi:hypothetical protein
MYNVYVVHGIVNTGVETNICDIERYITSNDFYAVAKFLNFKEHMVPNTRLIVSGLNTKKNILELELNLSKKEYVVSGFRVTSPDINECIEYYLCRRIFKLHE